MDVPADRLDPGPTAADKTRIEAALDAIVYTSLRPLATALVLIYALFACVDFIRFEPPLRLIVVARDFTWVLFFVVLWLAFRRNWVSPARAQAAVAMMALLVLLSIVVGVTLFPNPVWASYASIVLISSGCILLSGRWLAAVLLIANLAMMALTVWLLPRQYWFDLNMGFLAATAVSVIVHDMRLLNYTRVGVLRRRDEERKEELEKALAVAERELQERHLAETRYRDLVQGADAIVWEADPDTWEFSFVSDHAESILGYPPADWLHDGNFWVGIIHPSDRDWAVSHCKRCVAEGRDHEFEYRALHRDGRVVWLRDIVRVICDSEGKAVQLRGLMMDITPIREGEEEKAKLERQLRQVQKMEAIGTLAGGIAHDFNNLLAGIMGYAEMLKEEIAPGEKHYKAVTVILKAAERASHLTKQLLGFARRGKLQNRPIDLSAVIDEAAALLARTIDKNIVIRKKLRVGGTPVLGDPEQIEQIILNLAINARDAMPEGGELTFETELIELDEAYCQRYTYARPGSFVLVTVTDNGCGIPLEVRGRVFEPFFTTKEPGKGTGMGLAMVYGIVKNHNGFVQLYSEEGLGTKFKIYLPLASEPAQREREVEAPTRPAARNAKILIIDDEEVVREMASDMLRMLGYEVVTASDGRQGVELFAELQDEIDLAIIDMIMPELNGRDCFRLLREIDPDLKAILSTGYSRDGMAEEILGEGMVGFAQKPYRISELSRVVAEALN